MKKFLPTLRVLAAAGFLLSLTAHVMAIAGIPIPGGSLVMGLHVGIFVVWFPAVILMRQVVPQDQRKDSWKIMLARCPTWLRCGLPVLFVYAFLNFALFFASSAGQPKHASTDPLQLSTVRGFSGHWMIFYGVAFAIFHAQMALLPGRKRRCQNGHEESSLLRYCPQCGSPFEDDHGGA